MSSYSLLVPGAVALIIAGVLYIVVRASEQRGDYSMSPLAGASIIIGALGVVLCIVGVLKL